ncbi:MAG TPA: TIGR03435 family protein [Bryobacteraceae bacterium]
MRTITFLLALRLAAFGQAVPSFEVAVVKPAGPPTGWNAPRGIEGGRGTDDPGRISYSHLTLRTLLWAAYGVTDFQISGPAWLASELYDILANVPQGASEEQVAVMLQNLLADRFQLILHHEKRDLAVYVLVIGDGGAKLKQSEDALGKDDSSLTSAAGGQPQGDVRPAKPKRDKYGFGGAVPTGLEGRTAMYRMFGNQRLTAYKLSMGRLAVDWLAPEVGRPVVDMTGLKGNYDFTMTFLAERGPRPLGNGGDPGNPVGNAPDVVAAPNIFAAIQGQIGLKLESRRLPVDVLVVDKANKVPTEN